MPNVKIAFKPTKLVNTYGEYVSKHGLKQLRIAETEKYAHVTFFFNGGEEKQYPGEDRILVPSPKVATYDLQPEMSAPIVTEKVVEAINEDKYNAIILNFANPDMVGHTGSLPAAIKAVETVDECVGKIAKIIEEKKGNLIITADHGNDPATPSTDHSREYVPILVYGKNLKQNINLGTRKTYADIASTILDMCDLEQLKYGESFKEEIIK